MMTTPKARQAKGGTKSAGLTRTSIHMDAKVLKALDGVADLEGISRSALITRYTRAALEAQGVKVGGRRA